MGKEFGRDWSLAVRCPSEALKLIDANVPGLFIWIRKNLHIYSHYQVLCEFEDGEMWEVDEDGLRALPKRPTVIRFVPIVEGAGAFGRIIAGITLIAVSYWLGPAAGAKGFALMAAQTGMAIGASIAIGGLISLLSPTPKVSSGAEQRKDKTSFYFDGPVNTDQQGVPVPLIYGEEVLVGSQAISVSVTVDQLI